MRKSRIRSLSGIHKKVLFYEGRIFEDLSITNFEYKRIPREKVNVCIYKNFTEYSQGVISVVTRKTDIFGNGHRLLVFCDEIQEEVLLFPLFSLSLLIYTVTFFSYLKFCLFLLIVGRFGVHVLSVRELLVVGLFVEVKLLSSFSVTPFYYFIRSLLVLII